jgi:hypothetical protein
MLHLIASRRTLELGHMRAATLSVVAHAGLILAALTSRQSLPVRVPITGATAPVERIRFIVARPTTPTESRPSAPSRPSTLGPRRVAAPTVAPIGPVPRITLNIPAADIDTSVGVADLDLTGKITDTADFKSVSLAEAIGAALANRHSAVPMPGGIYRADAVDRVITPFADNPKPVYPRSLESMGVQADFTVMFVVDSTGRVDPGTLDMPRDVHRLFAEAVRYALLRSRYFPAQLAGRPVRQLVAQEFIFRMVR